MEIAYGIVPSMQGQGVATAAAGLLVEYAMSVKEGVKKVFLVHGEARGANGLIEALLEKTPDPFG